MKILILLSVLFISCNNSNPKMSQELEKKTSFSDTSNLPVLLINYTNEEILVALISLQNVIDTIQTSNKIINLEKIDSLLKLKNESTNLYNQFIIKYKIDEEDISTWIECYRLLTSFYFIKEKQISETSFMDDFITIAEFKKIVKKYLQGNSTIDSLSYSQERLIFLDVVNYLFQESQTQRLKIIKKVIGG